MQYVESFMEYIRSERRYSPYTVSGYGHDIGLFLDFLGAGDGGFNPAAVKADDVRAWIIHLTGQGLKNSSVNRRVSAVASMFRYFRKKGIVEKDPFLKIPALKTPEKLPVYITENKMARMADELLAESLDAPDFERRRDALLVLFLYCSGIRLSELVSIDRSDFEDGFSRLRVRGKGDKERIVPVIGVLRDRISPYISLINDLGICKSGEKALFLTGEGERISRGKVYRIVNGKLGEMGVTGKRSPHVLRHTFATHLLNGGADIREIQELLGHDSLQATQIYTHNSIVKLQQAYNSAHPRAAGAGRGPAK